MPGPRDYNMGKNNGNGTRINVHCEQAVFVCLSGPGEGSIPDFGRSAVGQVNHAATAGAGKGRGQGQQVRFNTSPTTIPPPAATPPPSYSNATMWNTSLGPIGIGMDDSGLDGMIRRWSPAPPSPN